MSMTARAATVSPPSLRQGQVWALILLCALAIAYLSFIPFLYAPLAPDEALQRFASLSYLSLRASRRADVIANALMYMPLGLLLARVVIPAPRGRVELRAVVFSLLTGTVWAVAVELAQFYFPNRTTSLNDIIASALGTLVGALLWVRTGHTWRLWFLRVIAGGARSARASLDAYVVLYFVLNLTPFDLVLGWEEFLQHLRSPLVGLWLAESGCGQLPCPVRLSLEGLLAVPIGFWWTLRLGRKAAVPEAMLAGFAVGMFFEVIQLLLFSGVSQGASVVARMAGVVLGTVLFAARGNLAMIDLKRFGRALVLAAVLPYLAALGFANGWRPGAFLAPARAWSRAAEVNWLPFYYVYYTTEYNAIQSALWQLLLYAPVGVAVWLWQRCSPAIAPSVAAALAAMLATVAELGKLFIPQRHPDLTDALIAAVAAGVVAALLRAVSKPQAAWAGAAIARPGASASRVYEAKARHMTGSPAPEFGVAEVSDALRSTTAVPGARTGASGATLPSRTDPASIVLRTLGFLLLVLAAILLAGFPLWRVALAVGLIAYALVLLRCPLCYLLVIPVALPVFDLAPLSGRFFWDEFDTLLLVTLGIRLAMGMPQRLRRIELPRWGLGLIAASVLISTAIAVMPPPPLDADAFSNYLSPYNALRVGKGYLWAGALIWLTWRDAAAGRDTGARLRLGLGAGLLAAAAGVLWERALFVGLFDLATYFRAAGFVSATHVGGAYLEAVLVALTPFAVVLAVENRRSLKGAFWLAVTACGAIAVLLTLSRAAFAAWLLAVVIALAVMAAGRGSPGSERGARSSLALGAALASIALIVALLVLAARSTVLGDRLATSQSDLASRVVQWRTSLELMRWDALHATFGLGTGSFPREYYLANAATMRLPAYRIEDDSQRDRRVLALMGGRGLYVDQRIDRSTTGSMRLRGEIRGSGGNARLLVGLCDKSLLNAVDCSFTEVAADTQWKPFEVALPAPRRSVLAPTSLTLHNGSFGTRIEVTGLSLASADRELLANGSFESGLDRWFVYSDTHLAWRAHNTPLQILIEQGLLGVMAWTVLAIGLVGRLARFRSAPSSAAVVAALVGAAAVGMFDTLFDAPRVILLTALILAVALMHDATREDVSAG